MEQFKNTRQLLFRGNIISPPAHMQGCARADWYVTACWMLRDWRKTYRFSANMAVLLWRLRPFSSPRQRKTGGRGRKVLHLCLPVSMTTGIMGVVGGQRWHRANLHSVKWTSPEEQPPVKPVQDTSHSPSLPPSIPALWPPSSTATAPVREEQPSLSGDNWLLLQHRPAIIPTPHAGRYTTRFNGTLWTWLLLRSSFTEAQNPQRGNSRTGREPQVEEEEEER